MQLPGMESRFGMSILPEDFQSNSIVPRSGLYHLPTGYRRPWALARQAVHDLSKDKKELLFGLDGFQACVDVHHFHPSEISVKTVDNEIIIEGKHEDRNDYLGSVQRHFIRKYQLPKNYDPNLVNSTLSTDGVLIVKAPLTVAIESGHRNVPIHHTNTPIHLSIKDNKKKETKKE